MSLNKEDLLAIREIVTEIVDQKLEPIRETLKEVLKAQVEIFKRIDYMQFQIDGIRTDLTL